MLKRRRRDILCHPLGVRLNSKCRRNLLVVLEHNGPDYDTHNVKRMKEITTSVSSKTRIYSSLSLSLLSSSWGLDDQFNIFFFSSSTFHFFFFFYIFLLQPALIRRLSSSAATHNYGTARHGYYIKQVSVGGGGGNGAGRGARAEKTSHNTKIVIVIFSRLLLLLLSFFNTQHGALEGFESVSVRLSLSPFPIFFYNAHFNREQTRPSCKGAFSIFFYE